MTQIDTRGEGDLKWPLLKIDHEMLSFRVLYLILVNPRSLYPTFLADI
jgi:hypothetical protein